jgi:hypothetical protein
MSEPGLGRETIPVNRWASMKLVTVTGMCLAIAVLVVYFLAAEKWTKTWKLDAQPSTIFPYLAAMVLFFTSCVWVIVESRSAVDAAFAQSRQDKALRIASLTFAIMFLVLAAAGMAGPEALKSIASIDCYLFTNVLADCDGSRYLQPFTYIAAAGNAVAVSAVVYIGMKCHTLTTAAAELPTADGLSASVRALSELLLLASTLLVTSTLTLFLLFSSAAEIASKIPLNQKSLQELKVAPIELTCSPLSKDRKVQCSLTIAEPSKSEKPLASSMAFVAGLSFTGALFFLFVTAAASLDDVIQRNLRTARAGARKFSTKTWLEERGLIEGTKDVVLRAVALVAPAATGTLTLLVG